MSEIVQPSSLTTATIIGIESYFGNWQRRRVQEAEMPGDPKECRQHARVCLHLAEAATDREITKTFVDLAHSWTRLAVELENAQALLVALDDMKQTVSIGTGRATTPIFARRD